MDQEAQQGRGPLPEAARRAGRLPELSDHEYAENWRKVIDQRTDLTAALGDGKAGFDQTLARLTRVNNAFTKRNGKLTQFSDELANVSAVEEYQALDAIFAENGANRESESPSTSPSSS